MLARWKLSLNLRSINYPGTVREHATVALDRTGNRKEGSVYFAMPTMVFQKAATPSANRANLATSKLLIEPTCAVRAYSANARICRPDIPEQDLLVLKSILPFLAAGLSTRFAQFQFIRNFLASGIIRVRAILPKRQ